MHEPTFFILTSLTGQPLHGYAIIQAVGKLSDGRITLRAGTLYAALDRLSGDDLITLDREEVVDSRLRRYYRLTDGGANALGAEVDRMRRSASIAAAGLRQLGTATLGTATLGTATLGTAALGTAALGAATLGGLTLGLSGASA